MNNEAIDIIAYYLSEYDMEAFQELGYTIRLKAYRAIAPEFGRKDSYLRRLVDEYDVVTSNHRNGQRNRPARKRILDISKRLSVLTFEELTILVKALIENQSFSSHSDDVVPIKFELQEEHHFISSLNTSTLPVIEQEIVYDNSPKPAKSATTSVSHKYSRSKTVAQRALAKAKYLCECDPTHATFKRKNSDVNYTEPHHLVPLYAAKDYPEIDLDREQNVVSLCSTCHNWLHYGDDIDLILRPLYEQRKDLLEAIGVQITYDQLRAYYI